MTWSQRHEGGSYSGRNMPDTAGMVQLLGRARKGRAAFPHPALSQKGSSQAAKIALELAVAVRGGPGPIPATRQGRGELIGKASATRARLAAIAGGAEGPRRV